MTWSTQAMRTSDGLRSLKWMRDAGWAGSLDVLVPTSYWTRRLTEEWVMVRGVSGATATTCVIGKVDGKRATWNLTEVKAVRLNAAGIAEAERLPEDCPFRGMALRAKAAGAGALAAVPTEADLLARRLA